MRRRVLFVDQSGALGGAELSLLSIAEDYKPHCRVVVLADGIFVDALGAAGIATTVMPLPGAVREVRRGAGALGLVRSLPRVAGPLWRLSRLARQYDIVYANTQKAFVIGAVAAALAGRPVIWHLRDILGEAHFSRLITRVVIWLSNHFCSGVIANSRATAAAFVAAGGDSRRVTVIWNGIDPRPFDAVSQDAIDAFRTKLGVKDAPLVGVFSRLSPWKGQHVLIEALARLPHVHALIVGEQLFGEEEYAERLREVAETSGVTSRVHFLGFCPDVPMLMRAVDVVVHTSTAPEPFGRVIVEGMLARKPVVATMGGGTTEIIQDGLNGIIVHPGEPDKLAAALRPLLEPGAMVDTLVSQGRRRAEESFSVATMLRLVNREIEARGSGGGSVDQSVLFIDQSGELGGAELCLLDVAMHRAGNCRVVLLSDGPFRTSLAKVGVPPALVKIPSAVLNVRRESGPERIAMAIPGVLLAICRLIGLALKSEVVYANTQKAFVIGALAGWVAGRPVIWHLHDILCEEHFSRASTGLVIWLSNRIATRVIANSRATAAAYIAAGGDESRVEVIWNGIDAEPFKRVDLQEIEKFKASLEIGNAPLIGVFGRLAPWKGQHILIEAMQHLPGVHAIVVGEGLYGEAEYARRLRREAKERGVAERVHFLGFSNQVPVLMRSVDVIVHTSTAPEPFGRVIVEGMMAERPVIATSGGGPEEILEAGVSGIIVRPNDPEALAGAVSQLLGPSPSKDLLVARGHARAIERFSLAGMLRHIDRVIDEVLNSSIVRSRQRHVPTGESMNRRGGELR